MIQDLLISSLRVWLFTPQITDIICSSLAELEVLKLQGETTSIRSLALRIFLYGFASSSWTKASLYLQGSMELLKPLKRQMGWVHLAIGSFLIHTTRPKPMVILPSGLKLLVAKRLLCLFLAGVGFDELLTAFWLFAVDKKRVIKGKKMKGTCMICLMDNINGIAVCDANHVAHSHCIAGWYRPTGSYKLCPACRQKMNLRIAQSRHFGWFRPYLVKFPIRFACSVISFSLMSMLYYGQMIVLKWRLRQLALMADYRRFKAAHG
jgi:hypothetical protein